MDLDRINSIMSRDVITLDPAESLKSAVMKMNAGDISCVVVVEENKPVGILTERDIIYLLGVDIDFDTVDLRTVMRSPVISISEDTELPEAANLMVINNLRRLVIVDGQHNVIGIVTQTDIIKNLSIDSFISLKKVEQIMTRNIVSVTEEETLKDAITLMAKNRISCILVIKENKPQGMITERNITKAVAENTTINHVSEIMTTAIPTTNKDMNLYDATRLMDDRRARSLTVVNAQGDVIGVVTKSDIIKNLRADYISILRNMLRQKSQALVESELKYRTLVEQSLEGILIIQDSVIRFVNPTLLRILNYQESEMTGIDVLRFLFPDSRDLLSENIRRASERMPTDSPLELRMIHKNEEGIFMEILLNHIQYEGNPAILITLRDITGRKKAEAELKRLVITDDLTGLYNQRYFYTQFTKEVERAKRHNRTLSLLLIDVDLFKDFNDTYGHWEGDFVLKKIGELLMKNVRDIDMAFRYGGEEFTVILPETNYHDAMIVAERIRKSVSQTLFYPFTLDGHPEIVSKTVSIGITEFHHDDTMKSFLKRADSAMYHAKKSGRNMVFRLQ